MGFNSHLDPLNNYDESGSSAYTTLFLLTGLAVATYTFIRFAESKNRLNYGNRFAEIIAGFLILMMRMLHTRSDDLKIPNAENKIITIGPHRTGWEAIAVASKMEGTPPRFFATTNFDSIPVVSSFMKMYKTIPVNANATRGDNGRSANADALDNASKVLSENGCVALFPQGNFARLGEEPPRVYAGAAKLALQNKVPIQVIRLDGFWCLQNPLIPTFIRNNTHYRAFLSFFHMNNVRATLCCTIDFHLKPENENLSDEEKIDEICAQLYSFYRHTDELSAKQIEAIKPEIEKKTHLLIWRNKVEQDGLRKQLQSLKKEEAELEEPTLASMKLS
ncbi:1-acyl-sn-glycerol-3-phosphate acyltransferase (plasmid) [Legionella lytica]|uniref:1-acyl-sn-glycerol-3-phosphate acyltransferase n=1 Tax=Legionella lytica TaxID=96232 RepID=A0ABY4YCB0_9GAMM|nr:lysophospholipid acyltransferase family protein [Legionella lytica]USQ15288.1 1-acyl-sn-glycerol-3-phosphate acyltransferase [Legionella lytica]